MSSLKVLIADDVEVMRKLLSSKLAKLDCDVVAQIANGDEILSEVEKCKPDMVFLDINMPGKSGLEVLKEIKGKVTNTFVVMVSAYNTFENIKQSMDIGADGFIVKPFSPKKLQEMIDKYKAQMKKAS